MDSSVSVSHHTVAFWRTYAAIICLANKHCPDRHKTRWHLYSYFTHFSFWMHVCTLWRSSLILFLKNKANWLEVRFILKGTSSCLHLRFMLGGIQAFGRREIFEFDVFLKNMYYGDFWSVLKKLWPEMQCCCFDQQRLALKISRLSFSTGLHWPALACNLAGGTGC